MRHETEEALRQNYAQPPGQAGINKANGQAPLQPITGAMLNRLGEIEGKIRASTGTIYEHLNALGVPDPEIGGSDARAPSETISQAIDSLDRAAVHLSAQLNRLLV